MQNLFAKFIITLLKQKSTLELRISQARFWYIFQRKGTCQRKARYLPFFRDRVRAGAKAGFLGFEIYTQKTRLEG